MKILAIETSCDETAIALLEAKGSIQKPIFKILGSKINSQIELHEQYGGVFPMMAKREHGINLVPLLMKTVKLKGFEKTISKAKINSIKKILEREKELSENFEKYLLDKIPKEKIDAIVVTEGPGLEPTLWVGISFAKALGKLWNIKVFGANHMEGHLLTPLLEKKYTKYPSLSLLVSGGHTELVYSKKPLQYEIIGKTKDDAVGEAFDKVARILGLTYPGGPKISKLADEARLQKLDKPTFSLPRPMIHSKDFDFSFSGIKTAVLYLVRDLGTLDETLRQNIAREFENAVVETLVHKTKKAIEKFKPKTLILGGGVSANKFLRKNLQKLSKEMKVKLILPKPKLSTDNALMIAVAGYLGIKSKKLKTPKKAEGNLSL